MLKAPFPYFGGKRAAAPIVWERFGDVGGYIEPFAGSAAVLLARPTPSGRRVETINDADGLVVNFWRAVATNPDTVAELAAGPVSEVDKVARNAYLLDWRDANLDRLYGDPEWCDVKAAAWWVYVQCAAIGNPFDGDGGWRSVVDADGVRRLQKVSGPGVRNGALRLGNAGCGVQKGALHLSNSGQGVHAAKPVTQWLRNLQTRLQHVRITCGDWTKPLRPSTLHATTGPNTTGIFLDPPYATSSNIYDGEHTNVATSVREWCINADPDLRIALCGYDDEHNELLDHGWTVETGKAGGSGYGRVQVAARERIWFSPACRVPGLW